MDECFDHPIVWESRVRNTTITAMRGPGSERAELYTVYAPFRVLPLLLFPHERHRSPTAFPCPGSKEPLGYKWPVVGSEFLQRLSEAFSCLGSRFIRMLALLAFQHSQERSFSLRGQCGTLTCTYSRALSIQFNWIRSTLLA